MENDSEHFNLIDSEESIGPVEKSEQSESNETFIYSSQEEILDALGAGDIAHLTTEQLQRLSNLMPQVDPEVAKAMLQQYPEFKAQVIAGLEVVKDNYAVTIDSNDKSQDHVFRALERTQDMLQGELNKDGNSPEDRRYLIDSYLKTTDKVIEQDKENKRFLDTAFGKSLITVSISVGLGALALTPKIIETVVKNRNLGV